jgi:hypothetical protein
MYCLRENKEHNWIALVQNTVKAIGLMQVRRNNAFFRNLEKAKNFVFTTKLNAGSGWKVILVQTSSATS